MRHKKGIYSKKFVKIAQIRQGEKVLKGIKWNNNVTVARY